MMKRDRGHLVWLDFTFIVFSPFGIFSWDIWRPLVHHLRICFRRLLRTANWCLTFFATRSLKYRYNKVSKECQFVTLEVSIFCPEVHFFGILLCFLIDLSFVPSKSWYTKCRTSEMGKGKATAIPHTKHMFAVHVSVDFLAGSDSNWNRPISSKESQLKYRVDTLAFGCAFCYGILIPCCLLYLYGKQHMVLEVNRTRLVTRRPFSSFVCCQGRGCSLVLPQNLICGSFLKALDLWHLRRFLPSTRAICACASMTFWAPRAKRFQGRTRLSHALWLQQLRHTSPCSIVDGCLGCASHVLESKLRSNPQKQFCYSVIVRGLCCSGGIVP